VKSTCNASSELGHGIAALPVSIFFTVSGRARKRAARRAPCRFAHGARRPRTAPTGIEKSELGNSVEEIATQRLATAREYRAELADETPAAPMA
jgi:hypothetical protein